MNDPTSQLRTATRRFKSDVANKLVGMFLHEVSRRLSKEWSLRVESEEYGRIVREHFENRCPYCNCDLSTTISVVEHLDGMNRYRAGLHVPGNVLVACRKCNGEKRRDDQLKTLVLASSGWESFLAHDGSRCLAPCATCVYWKNIWADDAHCRRELAENLSKIRNFRSQFAEFGEVQPSLAGALPSLLIKLYSDCQNFAETEITALVEKFERTQLEAKAEHG